MKFYCEACANEHTPKSRQDRIRRMGEVTYGEVRTAYGDHPWPRTVAGERMLLRDLRAIRGYPKDASKGKEQRLEHFLKLVLEQGSCGSKAARAAGVDGKRGYDALRALGYRYLNRGRWGNSGWFRRGRSGGITKSRAA